MATKVIDIEQDSSEVEAKYPVKPLLIRIIWLMVIVALFSLAYQQLTRSDVLPIQEIEVSGEFNQLVSQDLQPIIANGVEGNFFTVNVSDLYQQMLALPWVEKVWIHRIWPNTIKVNLQEQKPVGILKNRGLLNQNGEVFSQKSRAFEQTLPLFVVSKNYVEESVKEYQKKLQILEENGLKARIFYYDERKAQTIKLSNGIELVLGRVDVTERLKKFVKVYKTHLQNDKRIIDKVDLRYTNGLAVSWKQASAKSEFVKKQLA